ncbi:KEOPS complex subunit Cgi121 [Thermococcus sp. Bubb.Bath]|uniref:KEOPS complex subunit Cgi121 n=1 Tax=Thermococcus sp. Bubb.Bath TaxID=1638242 RepID=UPI00143C8D8C|nr:KEOPS complex subunit Cgi121 [Thermococcus sp. Bubb.Bath]NJF25999.1 KEOPS complex subunit Cgi121 [Thermococcus sp. Bubb.Bath]
MEEVIEGIVVGAVKVEKPERLIKSLGGNVQVVRAPCYEAVVHAAVLVKRAFERGTNHAKTLGGEFLLRLAGTLQIKEAIKKYGVAQGLNYLVVFGRVEEAEAFLKEHGLEEEKAVHCSKEVSKSLFEKSALTEVL